MNTMTMERPRSAAGAPLQETTVIVAYVNEPKGRARSASIKDVDGVYYWIKPDWLADFSPGATYRLRFTVKDDGNYTNRTVHSYELVSRAIAPVRTPPRSQAARQAAPAQRSAPVQQPHHEPQNGNGYYRPTHPRDAERIFVCAALGHFIDRGALKGEVGELVDAVNVLREVWRATFGQDEQAHG